MNPESDEEPDEECDIVLFPDSHHPKSSSVKEEIFNVDQEQNSAMPDIDRDDISGFVPFVEDVGIH